MTLEQLKNKVNVMRHRYIGHYIVNITYRGKSYQCISANTLAWDRIHETNIPANQITDCYTPKQAYATFYEACLRENHLGKYS